jgi:hypothetical protein
VNRVSAPLNLAALAARGTDRVLGALVSTWKRADAYRSEPSAAKVIAPRLLAPPNHDTEYVAVVVMPVFEDRTASARLFRELAALFGHAVHVVAVDDGSVREPLAIDDLRRAGVCGTLLTLKRNEGHQRAIAAGLEFAVGRFSARTSHFVVMDSDGEDLPASIVPLLHRLAAADIDVAVAQRRSRVETRRFRAFYAVYKQLFRLLSGREISFGNFIALKPAAARKVAGMPEAWIHFAASILASRLRVAFCPLDRGPRYAGRSKLNFVGLALHGFRGLMVFAEDVLVRVGIACAAVAGLAIAGMVTAVALKVAGLATPGWFSVALGILLLVFLQTGTLTLTMLMQTGLLRGARSTSMRYQEVVAAITATHDSSSGA